MALNVSFISLLLASAPRLAQVPSPESNSPRVERIPHHATERVGAVGQRQMAVFGGQINTVHGSLQQDSQFEVQLLEDSHQILQNFPSQTLRDTSRRQARCRCARSRGLPSSGESTDHYACLIGSCSEQLQELKRASGRMYKERQPVETSSLLHSCYKSCALHGPEMERREDHCRIRHSITQ